LRWPPGRLGRAIHSEGARRGGPFIPVNCGAIPEGLAESELFGHVAGAFTGAIQSRRGCFELAHKGTIFLDEFIEMPAPVQVKLLRVLQERKFQPLGSEESVRVDIRVIAATNQDPKEAIRRKRLRRDLYYRISVVPLVVPPLRDRREDLPELIHQFFNAIRIKLGSRVSAISPAALRILMRYAWPGNVRELINVMERTVLLCGGQSIEPDDLPLDIALAGEMEKPLPPAEIVRIPATTIRKSLTDSRKEVVDAFERRYIEALLRECHGHLNIVAERAGITRRALFQKMKRLKIRKEQFRAS
jgi:transcriptional regulator with PAS, ATPase and Fis domain